MFSEADKKIIIEEATKIVHKMLNEKASDRELAGRFYTYLRQACTQYAKHFPRKLRKLYNVNDEHQIFVKKVFFTSIKFLFRERLRLIDPT